MIIYRLNAALVAAWESIDARQLFDRAVGLQMFLAGAHHGDLFLAADICRPNAGPRRVSPLNMLINWSQTGLEPDIWTSYIVSWGRGRHFTVSE